MLEDVTHAAFGLPVLCLSPALFLVCALRTSQHSNKDKDLKCRVSRIFLIFLVSDLVSVLSRKWLGCSKSRMASVKGIEKVFAGCGGAVREGVMVLVSSQQRTNQRCNKHLGELRL